MSKYFIKKLKIVSDRSGRFIVHIFCINMNNVMKDKEVINI